MRAKLLEDAADRLEREAARLRAAAADARRIARAATERKRDFEDMHRLAAKVRAVMSAYQLDEDAAIRRVSFETGAPKATIRHYIASETRAEPRLARWYRNRRIVADARHATNEELAERYNLSPRTITTIISRAYRDAARVAETQRMP